MTGLTPYLSFDGTAHDALEFYRDVFGGELVLSTFGEFGRDDGPADRIAHGMLQGPVELFASDAGSGEQTLELRGILFSLLGTADPATLEEWFAALAEGGEVLDALALRPWGDHDGQVRDRFGVTWLIGYQG
ncbi:VOC family protein [Microbacterium hominis]|uniref:VOC family protein n=1 Tax=Microbacterium TaxID=33882 RepID=UPI00168A465F|nr:MULTISPECIES: VOC family protein [Microbacterium]QOC26696.1 VOC family protein [Microbacterium hominis]QOC27870.1 VOC family protein [Microbacterium hominis]QYF96976.1 VOC family protein [Microbacterium sp. PAMC21962]